jgi:hypothetical protein
MKLFRLRDDELPTWAHTLILVLITSVFAVPPLAWGISAIATGTVPEMRGWDGVLFMPRLADEGARVAGIAFICMGLTFLALGLRYVRWAQGWVTLRMLPWCFLLVFAILYFWAFILR